MASDQLLLLENQLCFALYSTSLAMGKVYQPLLKELGITYPQYLVLLVLWENDEVTVGFLGEKLHLDSGTLTPLLKRMEKSDLITRTRSDKDERQVLISLTKTALNLRNKAQEFPNKLLCAINSPISQVQELTETLKKLRANLHKNIQKKS